MENHSRVPTRAEMLRRTKFDSTSEVEESNDDDDEENDKARIAR